MGKDDKKDDKEDISKMFNTINMDDFKDIDWSNPDPEMMKKFQEKMNLNKDFDPSKFNFDKKDEDKKEEAAEEENADAEEKADESEEKPQEKTKEKTEEKTEEKSEPKSKIMKRSATLKGEPT